MSFSKLELLRTIFYYSLQHLSIVPMPNPMPNVAKDNAPSTANPPSAKKGRKDTTVPATVLRDICNAAAFLALVNVYGQGITGEKAMEKEVAKHFFGDESGGLASTLNLLLTGGAAFRGFVRRCYDGRRNRLRA